MVAAAQALTETGFARERIAFLPSHAAEPGPAAAEKIRTWWHNTPRYVCVSWCDKSSELMTHLIDRFAEHDAVARIDEVSGGLWRRHVYNDSAEWPSICATFEVPKFLYTLQGGRQLLAKFAGLNLAGPELLNSAQIAARQMKRTAEQGIGLAPFSVTEGFIITPWLRGQRLTRHDASTTVLTELGRYVAHSAGTPLEEQEYVAALHRLCDIASHNVSIALDTAAGTAAQNFTDRLLPHLAPLTARLAFGDGHMAPHEWVRTTPETFCKTDNAGASLDGNYVGIQCDAWDIAGIAVEWELKDEALSKVLQGYYVAGGTPHTDAELNFYRLAYAAFRAGQCTLSMDVESNADERARLTHTLKRYSDECVRRLAVSHD